jgi:hypothetical protein
MKNIRTIIFLSLFCATHLAFSQKVKYKDIFPLLEKKQYDAAEPLLKKYLEKEQDNPNAVLYMGIIQMEKYFKLQSTDPQGAGKAKDEAIRYLTQAKNEVNEWEVSKNEDYYTYYKRRNVRTGKVEVNASDVTYDIENRLKKLNGTEGQ